MQKQVATKMSDIFRAAVLQVKPLKRSMTFTETCAQTVYLQITDRKYRKCAQTANAVSSYYYIPI